MGGSRSTRFPFLLRLRGSRSSPRRVAFEDYTQPLACVLQGWRGNRQKNSILLLTVGVTGGAVTSSNRICECWR
jgi:hypothetical protein